MSTRTADLRVRVTSDTSSAAKSVAGVGSKVAGFAVKAVKAGGAIAAAFGAATLWKGLQRLTAIDDAEGKLRGLGYSAKQVDKIMSNALDSVKGTAFGLGDAATVAASTVAAGIKPGKDLTRTLSLVGDAATIAGTDFASMGAIFNKVAASNKIQGDAIAQLSDQGIPIIKLLSKELGVSADKVTELASKGKIDFATFQDAMEAGLGGAAQESGKTFTGALQNVWAAMGRLGAALLGGVFSQLPALFGKVIGWIDKLGPVAERVGEVVGEAFGRIGRAIADLAQSDRLHAVIGAIADAFRRLAPAIAQLGPLAVQAGQLLSTAFGRIGPTLAKLGPLAAKAGDVIREAFGKIGPAIVGLAPTAVQVGNAIAKAFRKIASVIVQLAKSDQLRALANAMLNFGKSVGRAAKTVGPPLKQIGTLLAPLVGGALVGAIMGAIIGLTAAFKLLGPAIEGVATVFAKLVKLAGNPVFQALAVILAAMFAPAIAQIVIFNAQMAIAVARVAAITAVQKAAALASKLWAAATWLVNAAMNANPIGLIILAIAALGAAIIILWKRCETFRKIVKGAFAAAVTAGKAVGRAFQAIGRAAQTVFGWIKSHWRLIAAILFGPVGIAVGVITKYWSQIKSGVNTLISGIKSVFRTGFAAILGFIRGYVTTIKTVINGIKTAVDKVIAVVRTLADKFGLLKLPGALKTAIDAIKTAIDKVVDAVGDLISKIGSIPTPKINWPSPPGWFNKVFKSALPPSPDVATAGGPAAPSVAMRRGLGVGAASTATATPMVQINVTGALDPEAVARQINRILAGHSRRVGLAT